MNVHKNARSCPVSRELLIRRVSEQGWSVRAASEAAGMSDRRARGVDPARSSRRTSDRSQLASSFERNYERGQAREGHRAATTVADGASDSQLIAAA